MVAEQCQVPEAADITAPSKGSADRGMKVLTVCGGPEPSALCLEDCNMNMDRSEPCMFCNGNFTLHSACDEMFDADRTLAECDTWGLSQPFDERALYCECFRPCKSPEHRANHSLASKCSSCCEHCAGHLQLFQQCKPSDQLLESSDSEPDELEVSCDSLGQHAMSQLTPEDADHNEVLEQYEPCQCSDAEPDTSAEDSEQSDMSDFTPDLSNSTESLECGAELYECDETQNQAESTSGDEEERCSEDEQNEEELSDEELPGYSEETPDDAYFEDGEDAPDASEVCEDFLYTDDTSVQDATGDEATEFYENEDPEDSRECEPNQDSEFGAEDDGTSECSSGETNCFQTCSDDSVPCSESSGDSDKEAQGDSSDELTQWESFEEEEETEQSKINRSNEELKKTPAVDVIENYFDLFDRSDYCDHMYAQKQRYISCFEGGDIHDRLYLEEQVGRCNVKTVQEPVVVEATDLPESPEDAPDDTYEEDSSQTDESWDSEKQSGSSLAGDEAEEDESETQENSEEAEDDEVPSDGGGYAFDGQVSEACDEDSEGCLSSGTEESMSAPCAKEISVEGDAYEDEIFLPQNIEAEETSTDEDDGIAWAEDQEEPEDKVLIACSEREPYWSLLDIEEIGELSESGVEDYYSYQIIRDESFVKQAFDGFMMEGRLYKQNIDGRVDRDASRDKKKDGLLSGNETDGVSLKKNKRSAFGITQVIDLNCSSDDDSGIEEVTREIRPPSNIIHSVVYEKAKTEGREVEGSDDDEAYEQSGDSEEDQSDDESYETCECEYCIPPEEQVTTQPLLPQLPSSDAGKICVVIDLDETLVHSSFKPVNNADFSIPVEIDGTVHQVYVLKRPYVDEFLKRMGEMFECVLFTASLSKYADPVSDLLDKCGAFQSRLFRESCVFHKGNYVKDLSRMGRDLNKVIIIDNSPASYVFHPENAVPVTSWFDDTSDTELLDLIPFFERLSKVDDIHDILSEQRTSS